MHLSLIRNPAILAVSAGLLLGGCATRDAVDQAQSTADTAKNNAAAAMAAAQKAQNDADAALRQAQQAASAAQAADVRIDKLAETRKEQSERRRYARHHHHAHKQAALHSTECPPQHS